MLQEDLYIDERPKETPDEEKELPDGDWVYPPAGEEDVPIQGEWGSNNNDSPDSPDTDDNTGGGNGGGGGASGDLWYDLIDSSWGMTTPLLLLDGSGVLLTEGNGVLLKGVDGCLTIDIDCQIQGDNGQHVRCIILRSIMSELDTQPYYTSASFLLQNLVSRGKITLAACWQAGHWDYAAVHTVRFRIRDGIDQEVITPCIKLAMNPAMTSFATLSLDENGLIIQTIRS
ncbi:MAG: hypothetical protein IKA79_03715 [Lentisphaeria bacterium]|nr:hypothetical protein [Lentisphaeria bacterium]